MRAWGWLLLTAGALLLQGCEPAPPGLPRLESVVVSDAKDGAAKTVFAPDTAQIVLMATLRDVPAGATVSAAWIAAQTEVAPPDFVIDKTELAVAEGRDVATFTLSRPDAGWPAGSYRVELTIDGAAAETATFTVAE